MACSFQHQAAHSSGRGVSRRSSPRGPLPISGAGLVGCWGGERAGLLRYKGEQRLGASCVPPRAGWFYQKKTSKLANIPSSVHQPSARPLCSRDLRPRQGPAPECHLCARPRASTNSRGFDARCHARSRLRVEPWRAVSQSVGGQSKPSRCHAMLLESAVSLLIAPYSQGSRARCFVSGLWSQSRARHGEIEPEPEPAANTPNSCRLFTE